MGEIPPAFRGGTQSTTLLSQQQVDSAGLVAFVQLARITIETVAPAPSE